jgi:hypothetical protein
MEIWSNNGFPLHPYSSFLIISIHHLGHSEIQQFLEPEISHNALYDRNLSPGPLTPNVNLTLNLLHILPILIVTHSSHSLFSNTQFNVEPITITRKIQFLIKAMKPGKRDRFQEHQQDTFPPVCVS